MHKRQNNLLYCETLIYTECLYTINLGPTGPVRPHTMEVATASIHPSCSPLSQGTPTSSRPLLPSVPAQLTTSKHLSVAFTSTSTSMISENIQLLGKHPANTQDETSSSKHQRTLYTSDTPPVGWKPPTSSTAFPHILGIK